MKEIIYLTFTDLTFTYGRSLDYHQFEFQLEDIQLDNMLYDCQHPCIVTKNKIAGTSSKPVVHISWVIKSAGNISKDSLLFPYFSILVQVLTFF